MSDRGKDDLDEGPKLFVFPDLESELISVKIDAKDAIPTNRFRYRVKMVADPALDTSGTAHSYPILTNTEIHHHTGEILMADADHHSVEPTPSAGEGVPAGTGIAPNMAGALS